MRRPGVPPLAAFALWFVARYAAGVAPDAAGRWLAHAERILSALDSSCGPRASCATRPWPCSGSAIPPLCSTSTPPLDHAAALADAAAWLEERDPNERASRRASRDFASGLTNGK